MEEEITSFIITRHSALYCDYVVNDNPLPEACDAYTGTLDGEYIVFKSLNGAPQTKRVPYTVIQYLDATDSGNNLIDPPNAQTMFRHLVEQNFFVGSSDNGGGGGSGVTTLKALYDVNIPSFLGQAGKVLIIAPNEQYVITGNVSTVQSFLDLNDVFIGEYNSNSYLLTNSTGTGIIQSPVSQIINRPYMFNEAGVIHKGYTIVDGEVVPNTEVYAIEIGDIVQGWIYDETAERWYFMEAGKYLGGSMDLMTSYIWNKREYYNE